MPHQEPVQPQSAVHRCDGEFASFSTLRQHHCLESGRCSFDANVSSGQRSPFTGRARVLDFRFHTMEQNPPFPSPEELKSKLAEFMKSNFGDRVAFTTLTQPDTVETGTDEKSLPEEAKDFEFHFLPRDIKAHLDRFVIKQDEAKKVLSIAVCDHYNHVNHVRQLEKEHADSAVETEYAKQNVILVGPTGVGKTYLIKHIADLIKVPFVKADATKFSAASNDRSDSAPNRFG